VANTPFFKRCEKEVQLLKKIDSKNVIRLYESFYKKEHLYISLEYADAGDMENFLKRKKIKGRLISERAIWYYFHQICNGLKDLHAAQILHRDLKPANILLTTTGRVKIGDLGLSCLLNGGRKYATSQLGTQYYMSPERTKSGVGYAFKSDIWSLGCILYEFCTLRSPFEGEQKNEYSLYSKIAAARYLPIPSEIFSFQLQFFIKQCLSISPQDRPSAEETYHASGRMFNVFEELLLQHNKSTEKPTKTEE
uniref:Protein kinase domain-containing protein n=1 Tax=Panagrolaimus sp. ES5 TaxID=591445 RepID=A0AC34G5P6_9BILA